MAALKTRQIDGMIVEANAGYRMEEDGSGRVLVHSVTVSRCSHPHRYPRERRVLQQTPKASSFLAASRCHRLHAPASRETIDNVSNAAEVPRASRCATMTSMGFHGPRQSRPAALDVLARSFVEMGLLPQAPDVRSLVTERYLPARR